MIISSILKQFQTFFKGRNLLNLWVKQLILEGYSAGVNFNHNKKIIKWKITERNVSTKSSIYQFKRVNGNFLLKPALAVKAVIYVVICQEWKEKYIEETCYLIKERINLSKQRKRQTQYQQLAAKEQLRNRGDEKFHMFLIFKIPQESTSLRKSYKDYFTGKFKPLLYKKA